MNNDHNLAYSLKNEMIETGKRWNDLSEEEKNLFERFYYNQALDLIKHGISYIGSVAFVKYHEKQKEEGQNLLETYSSEALLYDIREGLKNGYYDIVLNLDNLDISAFDAWTQEILGINPKFFVHNCTILSPEKKENKEWFRKVFDSSVEKAETIIDLLKINNFDFRIIPDFLSPDESLIYNYYGSSRRWFGKKSFYTYRDRYMKKFLELADNATFEELWFVIDCFCDCKTYNTRRFRKRQVEAFEKCSPESAKSFFNYSDWLEYIMYHKTKHKIAEGLPLKWILPLDQKCMEEIICKALQKTNFEECLRIYNTRIINSLKIQILERLSSLASTAEEHFTVASIAHKKGEPFNNVWRKHILLTAKTLRAKN